MPARAAEPVDGPAVSVSVLGTVSVAVFGRDIRIKNRKSRAVLAYVVLNEVLRETRERLVGLFWSESDEEKARGSLRQTLRELRALFDEAGYRGFHTDKLAVELDRDSIEVDLWAVIRNADAGRVHPLLLDRPRLTDALLEGLDDLDPAFRIWLLAKRETIHSRLLRGLEAGLRADDLNATTVNRLAEAIINLDPTHEEACRHLMRAKAEAGDVSGALRVYKALWDLLDDEYDMEPSPPTQQLVADIKTGQVEPQAAPPSIVPTIAAAPSSMLTTPPQPRALREGSHPAARIELAVEPFEMEGVDPGKLHLVVGFRQHLVASLVRFREWYVTDRSFQAKAGNARLPVSGHYALRAVARQNEGVLFIVVVLVELDSNVYVWGDDFELKLENWFEAQQRIVRRLATALNVQLSAERLARFGGEPDIALDLYDRWLRAQAMILSFNPDEWGRAALIFNETIRAAPSFSPGYSSLAQLNNTVHIVHPGIFRNRAKEKESLDLARTAVNLDPIDSRAQLSLGWAYALAGQYDQAEVHMDLASELNPNDPWTLISTALFYAFGGKLERSLAYADRALDVTLAPTRAHWAYDVTIQLLRGNDEAVIRAADNAGDAPRSLPAWRAVALHYLGRQKEAAQEARRFVSGARSNWFGAVPPTDETIVRWVLHIQPIARRSDWERLRIGLKGAGLPVDALEFNDW
jgi:DNA-binding SARP family transcriptional activator/TolB-like protein